MSIRLPVALVVCIVSIQPLQADELAGTVKSIKAANVVVTDQRGKEKTFLVTAATKLLKQDKPARLTDIKTNYRVRVRYEKKETSLIALEIDIQGMSLRIVGIELDKKMLILKDKEGKNIQIPIDPDAKIRLDGQEKKLSDLRPGDAAKVFVTEIDKGVKDKLKTTVHIEAQSATAAIVGAGPEEGGATPVEEDKFVKIKVFYGTDRNPVDASKPDAVTSTQTGLAPLFKWLTIGALVVALLFFLIARKWELGWVWHLMTASLTVAFMVGLGWYWSRPGSLPTAEKLARVGIWYSADRGKPVFGVCDVSIPKSHKHAELEGPRLSRLEFREDPAKHIMLHEVKQLELAEFVAQVKEKVKGSFKEDAFVFVHGYNVSFEDAARRTGQLAYDLKFEGAPMFYSWPAQGLFMQYTVDEANAEWAMPHFKEFLKEVATKTDAKVIHLIAHSMGNRVLTRALQALVQEDGNAAPRFNQVVLAAPDIDAEVFRTQIYPAIAGSANRLTLYASSRDRALQLSKQVHGYARAGESGDDILLLPKLDSIDVSNVDTSIDGHSYYGGNSSVISDVYYLLQDGLPPTKRARLREAVRRDQKYWIFVP